MHGSQPFPRIRPFVDWYTAGVIVKGKLVDLLEKILPFARFNVHPTLMDLGAYRNLYEDTRAFRIHGLVPSRFIDAEVNVDNVPKPLFDRLVESLRSAFGPFLDQKNSRIAFAASRATGGGTNPHPEIELFAKRAIKCAALAGSDRTVVTILGWIEGEPIRYTEMTLLQGIRQEQDRLELQAGVQLIRLGRDNGLFHVIPEDLARKILDSHEWGILGASVLCINVTASPSLFEPSDIGPGPLKFGEVTRELPIRHAKYMIPALSLACDGSVIALHSWKDFEIELAILAGCRDQTVSYDQPSDMWRASAELTQEKLDHAGRICDKLGEQFDGQSVSSLGVAIHRWIQSKALLDPVTDSIDVRIALEALFGDGTETSELSFRLAARGAWYVATDPNERIEHFDTLRDAYRTGSKAVHRGVLKKNPSDVLSKAHDICRSAILKRLDKGKAPDWKALILGSAAE